MSTLNTLLLVLFLALVRMGWAGFDLPRVRQLPPPAPAIRVSATAYTCDVHPLNPMNAPGMCRVLANGSRDVFSRGMACPRGWMGRAFDVPEHGVLVCDDSGAYDRWNGLDHIDIRMTTYEAAREWGTRTIEIREVTP